MWIVTKHAEGRFLERISPDCKNPRAEIVKAINKFYKMKREKDVEVYYTKRGLRFVCQGNKIITIHKMNNKKRHFYSKRT